MDTFVGLSKFPFRQLELALEFVTIVDESFVQIACDVAINLSFWEKRNFDEILFIGLYNELWTICVLWRIHSQLVS